MSRYDDRRYDDGRPSYSASTYRPGERRRTPPPPYENRGPAPHGPDGADRRLADSSWNAPPRYQPPPRSPPRYGRNSPPAQRPDQTYGNTRPPHLGRPRSPVDPRDDQARGGRPYHNDHGPRRFPAENNYRPRNYSRSPPRAANLSSNHTPLGSRRTSPHRQGERPGPDIVRPDPRTPRVDTNVSRIDARDQSRGNIGSNSAYPPSATSFELKQRPFETPEAIRTDCEAMAPNSARGSILDAPSGPRGQSTAGNHYQTPHGPQDRRETHAHPASLNLRTETMPERPSDRGPPRRAFDVTPHTPRGPKGYDRHDQFRAPYRANTLGTQRIPPHEKYLAGIYTLTEAGKKPPTLLDPVQEKRMAQLEEDQRKLTETMIAKQATLRVAMYEWEKAEGDVAREEFKVEMANQQLAKITGSDTGGISSTAY